MVQTDLSRYDNSWFDRGAGKLKWFCWLIVSACFVNSLFPYSGLKIFLLRLFGAEIGKKVVVKPSVNIKFPWKLHIGDFSWIGERAWIDNLAHVNIGKHCCISQGAVLLTGNHDFSRQTFDLITRGIILEDGVWIGAGAMVCPGVVCKTHSVLSAGSVTSADLEGYSVYRGNPAIKIRDRIIS
ncbi:MAG: colanic acid biosynthesis acetyltransferase WcaF [Bacteroidetes bacterium]|nr:colanic acid biosynthesis acetyltransferase WcaF [Bacteroidota bacterium]